MKHAVRLSQYRQKGMMRFASGAGRIVAFCSTLLLATALKNGGIQIQTEPFRWYAKHSEQPLPKGTPESLDRSLREA